MRECVSKVDERVDLPAARFSTSTHLQPRMLWAWLAGPVVSQRECSGGELDHACNPPPWVWCSAQSGVFCSIRERASPVRPCRSSRDKLPAFVLVVEGVGGGRGKLLRLTDRVMVGEEGLSLCMCGVQEDGDEVEGSKVFLVCELDFCMSHATNELCMYVWQRGTSLWRSSPVPVISNKKRHSIKMAESLSNPPRPIPIVSF